MTDEPIGTILAGYRLEELIGRGGMSAVYRAEHVHLGKHVALKILSPALAQDEDFRERFLRESRTAASIDHPNIIPIYDAGEVDGRLYIAMRFVDGFDLKKLIEREGALSLGRTVFFIEQVASALDTAHACNLVHRDVKPANVLVATGTERLFLTDFGVVKHAGSTGLTRTGYFLGTIDYAAPEQIEGRPVDARTDVYAVGCLVYECLTGSAPFERAGEMAVIHAHLTEEPPKPSVKRSDLPAAVDRVVAIAMAKEQAQRYASAGALAQSLRAVAFDDVADTGRWEARGTTAFADPRPAEVPSAEPATPPPGAPPSGAAGDTDHRRSRRWTIGKKGIVIVGVLAAAAAAATALAITTSGGSHPQASMSDAAMTRGGYPDAIEREVLLEHIPMGIRSSCRRISPIATAVFLRSVKCAQGGGQGSVTYSRAHSGDALRAYFLRQVQDAGLRYPTAAACRQRQPAADEWQREGLLTHFEGPSPSAEGRVLCYREGSVASIAWTDTSTKTFARASRPGGQWQSLYAWWRTAAGPEKDLGTMAMASVEGSYPNAIEQELLLHHIPPAIRRSCSRSNSFDRTVFLAAVSCSPPITGGSVEYMYAHNGSALKVYSNNEITAAGLNFPTSDTCANGSNAADTWLRKDDTGHGEAHFSRQAEGRVLCYVAGGQAVIEWTDSPTGIYARAMAPAKTRRALYEWWKNGAGPGALEVGAMTGNAMG